ncbi:uncharacterized protein LOC134726300 [Mytilus trossulus]|uniref:uncharacterized protein LOC134726300 n=1 Tax=Mytilus trossulus TaxID=6551 RepID=UPI003004DAEF
MSSNDIGLMPYGEPQLEDEQKQQESLTIPNENMKRGIEITEDQNNIKSPKGDRINEYCNYTPLKPKKKGRPKGKPKRKASNFMTPPKKSLIRNQRANPETWKKNIRKKLRLSGKEYISAKGKVVEEKKVKSVDCSKCTYKCNLGIDEEHRQQIFTTFWSLDTDARKKDFIIATLLS